MTFVALLRAINVGGTGKLPMQELAELCTHLSFRNVRTYIQSGNVVFDSPLAQKRIRKILEDALLEKMGKPVDVVVRTSIELRRVLEANPFFDRQPNKVSIFFLGDLMAKGLLDGLVTPGGEEVRVGAQEIYIYYPNGMGQSKLKLPAKVGVATARNINTVTRLVTIAENADERIP